MRKLVLSVVILGSWFSAVGFAAQVSLEDLSLKDEEVLMEELSLNPDMACVVSGDFPSSIISGNFPNSVISGNFPDAVISGNFPTSKPPIDSNAVTIQDVDGSATLPSPQY